jgi:hypothetical protein
MREDDVRHIKPFFMGVLALGLAYVFIMKIVLFVWSIKWEELNLGLDELAGIPRSDMQGGPLCWVVFSNLIMSYLL